MQFPIFRSRGRSAALLVLVAGALPGLAVADLNELQKLAPTANALAGAGQSVAVSGGVAVVGAPDDTATGCVPGAGAAYVYVLSGAIWMNQQTLCAADGVSGDAFGASVSVTNGNIAVGAPGAQSNTGAVYVFNTTDNLAWSPLTTLSAGAAAGGRLGSSVSIQGSTIAAGAPHTSVGNHTNTGVTIVYTSNDSGVTWTHTFFRANGGQARTGSLFGSAVSLSGSTILVGAPGYHTGSKQNSGNIFVFVNNGSIWTQQANIRPGNVAQAFTGTGVSLFQNTAAFGAPGNNRVYIYRRTGTSWANTTTITGSSGIGFGTSVSLQGSPAFSFLSVGAPGANSGGGRAFEYGSTGGAYTLKNELIATDNAAGDGFGTSTSLDAGQVFVGAPDNLTFGAAYVFEFQNPSITKITGFSVDPSSTGVPYTVTATVTDGSGNNGTPSGSVHFDDSNGGTCDAPLILDPDLGNTDGHAIGSCLITSNFFGSLTMNASYGGDTDFSASSDSTSHNVVGNHFAFVPAVPADQLQGTELTGVSIELLDGADHVITSDSTTQVSVVVNDTCGDSDAIATVKLTNGVADLSGLGPKFYTVTAPNKALNMNAQQSPFSVLTSPTSATSGNFDVAANPDLPFADGFEDCRL